MTRPLPEIAPGTSATDRALIEAGKGFVRQCPECGKLVVQGDDFTALDYPQEPWSEGKGAVWTITKMRGIAFIGTRYVASQANPALQGTAHRLHEHQDPRAWVRTSRFPWHRPGTDKTRSTQA